MTKIQDLLDKLEDERSKWNLTDSDLAKFNTYWNLRINTDLNKWWDIWNVHMDSLNKTWDNYKNTAFQTANQLANVTFDAANKQTAIEKAKNSVKEARSDETRAELLKTTGEFKDKQETRYQDVKDITNRQKSIANREANIAQAKAGRYWDVFSDWAMANVKNDIIAKYGKNILSAEQYALNTNRTIDNDLLNVWLKELDDKNSRDAFKNTLLDKENSYMLNAIKEAADWNKKAIKDVETFYQAYTKQKADEEFKMSTHTERREWLDNEFESLDETQKISMLRDLSQWIPWYNLVADRLPSLIETYNREWLSLAEMRGKIEKTAELALTWNQQLASIQAIPEDKRTDEQNAFLKQALRRWLEVKERSDRSSDKTIKQSDEREERDRNTYEQNKDNRRNALEEEQLKKQERVNRIKNIKTYKEKLSKYENALNSKSVDWLYKGKPIKYWKNKIRTALRKKYDI